MENPSPFPHSSNLILIQTLLGNPTNDSNQATQKKKAMRNFQEFIYKLAETHPNKPLIPATKTILQGRLNRFVSEYKTPDHPPYSAMIQRALEDLNEKKGSSEKSISQHLEKIYDNLPWAHSVLLKHHLEELCETGEIGVTRDKRYGLPGCLISSTEVKRKQPRRKSRYDWEREKHNRPKQKLVKERNQRKCEKDEFIKKHHEHDEKEQQFTENGARSENKSNQTEKLLSCMKGENGVCSEGYSDARSQQLEADPFETVKADVWAKQTQEHQQREQLEYTRLERPPSFETIGVESLPHSGSTKLELASTAKLIGSNRAWRQLKRWNRKSLESKAVTVTSFELLAFPEQNHAMEASHNQQKAFESSPITAKQMNQEKQQIELPNADVVEVVQSVVTDNELKRDEKYGGRRKKKSKKSETSGIHVSKKSKQPAELQNEHLLVPCTKIDSPSLPLTLNPKEDTFQEKKLRRSSRNCRGKPEVAKEPNFVACMDESQRKCRRLRVLPKSKPDREDVGILRVADDQRRQADWTSICEKMETPRRMKVLLRRNSMY